MRAHPAEAGRGAESKQDGAASDTDTCGLAGQQNACSSADACGDEGLTWCGSWCVTATATRKDEALRLGHWPVLTQSLLVWKTPLHAHEIPRAHDKTRGDSFDRTCL